MPFTDYGYQRIRTLINSDEAAPGQWAYVALLDSTGVEVIRDHIETSARADWETVSTDATQTLMIEVQGSEVSLPTTLSEMHLYESATAPESEALATEVLTEGYRLEEPEDSHTVRLHIEVP